MKSHFICLFLFLNICSFSQIFFNRTYEFPVSLNSCSSVLEINNSGYITNGTFLIPGPTPDGIAIVRTDLNGDTIFQRYYADSSSVFSAGASGSLIRTNDGNFILCGSGFLISNSNQYAHVMKFDMNGDTLWTRQYGGTGNDHFNVVIECAEDSGLVFIGYTTSYGNGASDYYMVKTDKNGTQLWQRTFGTAQSEDAVGGIRTLDGGYILSGVKNNAQYIVKTDANGNYLWQKYYNTINGIAFINQLPDSNLILCGTEIVTGLSDQAYIAKADKLGNIIWANTYGGTTTEILYAKPVLLTDGSIVCSGIKTYGANIPYGYLLKVDANGNQQWERSYYKNPNIDNYFYDVKQTSDGGFIMCGSANNPNQDHWLVKVDSNGCEVVNCNTGQEDENVIVNKLEVFPNPSTGIFTLKKTTDEQAQIIVFDMLGNSCLTLTLSKGEETKTIDLTGFAKGVYFIKLIESEKTFAQKIIVY